MIVAVGLIEWIGFYFVTGLYMGFFARFIGRYKWMGPGHRHRVPGAHLPVVREGVPRLPAEEHPLRAGLPHLELETHGDPHRIRRHAGQPWRGFGTRFSHSTCCCSRSAAPGSRHRRAAGTGRHQRRRDPPARSRSSSRTPDRAVRRARSSFFAALLGSAVRRRHHLHLFNIPGEPWSSSALRRLPAREEARQTALALTSSFFASFIGALIATSCSRFFARALADVPLAFGPAELFAVFIMSFATLIALGRIAIEGVMMIGFGLLWQPSASTRSPARPASPSTASRSFRGSDSSRSRSASSAWARSSPPPRSRASVSSSA